MEKVGDWIVTYAEFLDNFEESEKLKDLGIDTTEEKSLSEFRFKLSALTSYNKSETGNATVDVYGFRITLADKFEDFDKFILENS